MDPRVTLTGSAAERLLLGAGLLGWPAPVARAITGQSSAPPSWLLRLLGGRLVAQGAVLLARPRPGVARVGAIIDATHALSMVPAALLFPAHRRAAVISGVEAAAAAAMGAAVIRRLT